MVYRLACQLCLGSFWFMGLLLIAAALHILPVENDPLELIAGVSIVLLAWLALWPEIRST